jgi:hypothetical protein
LQIVGILAGQEQKNDLYGAIIQSSGDDWRYWQYMPCSESM